MPSWRRRPAGPCGRYWLLASGDQAYACETSLVGSIGVVSSSFGAVDAMQRLGIERRVWTAGVAKAQVGAHAAAAPPALAGYCGWAISPRARRILRLGDPPPALAAFAATYAGDRHSTDANPEAAAGPLLPLLPPLPRTRRESSGSRLQNRIAARTTTRLAPCPPARRWTPSPPCSQSRRRGCVT